MVEMGFTIDGTFEFEKEKENTDKCRDPLSTFNASTRKSL